MRPKFLLVLAVTCCAITVLASPSLAAADGAQSENPIAAIFGPADSGTLRTGTPEPLFLSGCFVQVECADTSVVSCSGSSSCTTSGINNRCVTCDSVPHGCCPITCCENCAMNRDSCSDNCPDWPLACFRGCSNTYNTCIAGCMGGCS